MDSVREFFKGDRFAARNGVSLLEVRPGYAKARMLVEEHHCNGYRIAHGGAIFTLADFAFAVAANSHGTVAVAVNVNISFVKAGELGVLLAEAREVSRGPKLSSYTVHVTNEAGELIAVFQGLAYSKKESLAEVMAHEKKA